VKNEHVAVVLGCEALDLHWKQDQIDPFLTEEDRCKWLKAKSRELATAYLKRKNREQIKEQAIRAAIRHHPQSGL
jgi:hypothetical protein